jgi:riboflavin kinase / FMN adenylyltransferase
MQRPVVDTLAAVDGGKHVVTVGSFDGVHRGHQYLLARVVERARDHGCRSLVVTFDPLPIEVLRPDRAAPRLTTTGERVRQILRTGVDQIVVINFDRVFAARTADQFVADLVTHATPVEMIVGHDFAFGHNRTGTAEYLVEVGPTLGFSTEVIQRVSMDGLELSSSATRTALLDSGDARHAAAILGRPFRLTGTVENGARRGRDLGYPTANLDISENLVIPADGIYAALSSLPGGDVENPSLVYVGKRPTFDGDRRIVEVFLLDTDCDLYGTEVSVDFLERIRGDRRFESAEALVEQMNDDERVAREFFKRAGYDRSGAMNRT